MRPLDFAHEISLPVGFYNIVPPIPPVKAYGLENNGYFVSTGVSEGGQPLMKRVVETTISGL